MLPPSARALWPFFVRSDAARDHLPVPRRRSGAAVIRSGAPDHLPVQKITDIDILLFGARAAGSLPALGSVVERLHCNCVSGAGCSNPGADH